MDQMVPFVSEPVNVVGNNIDELILKGIKNIKDTGELFEARQALVN